MDRSGDEQSREARRPAGQLVRLVLLSTVLPPFVDKLTLHVATKQRVSVALCGISRDKCRYSIFEPVFTARSAPNRSTRSRMKHEDFGRDRRCGSATLVAATYLNFSFKTKLTYNAIITQFSLWLVLIYKLGRVDAQSVS